MCALSCAAQHGVRTQMIAIRTARHLKVLTVAVSAFLALVVVLAALYPRSGASFLQSIAHWAWAIPLGVVACFALEASGSWLLSRPFIERRSPFGRISITVAMVVLIVIACITAAQFFNVDAF
jgi:hypothetical protein